MGFLHCVARTNLWVISHFSFRKVLACRSSLFVPEKVFPRKTSKNVCGTCTEMSTDKTIWQFRFHVHIHNHRHLGQPVLGEGDPTVPRDHLRHVELDPGLGVGGNSVDIVVRLKTFCSFLFSDLLTCLWVTVTSLKQPTRSVGEAKSAALSVWTMVLAATCSYFTMG